MKKNLLLLLLLTMVFWQTVAWAQRVDREVRREFVSPEEIVSFSRTTPFDQVIQALSEVSKRFTGKVIIDPAKRTSPIDVDVEGRHWRDALDMVLRANQMWYSEFRDYIEVYFLVEEEIVTPGEVPRPTLKTREVRISAVFFEVNLVKLTEAGINWNFLKSKGEKPFPETEINATFLSGQRASDVYKVEVLPNVSFGNLDAIARLFSSYSLGKILASPEVTVRNGIRGNIQVGQSISIKQRDFAGNLIDVFIDTGTILNVVPQIISDGENTFVHLVIKAERSSGVPGEISTVITKTTAETEVLLLDGEETIIGGLYASEEINVREGIPILKDLPWWVLGIRYLTGFNRKTYNQRELIVLLKVDLVPTLEERIAAEARRRDVIKEKQREWNREIRRRMNNK